MPLADSFTALWVTTLWPVGENSGLQLTAMYANNIRPFKRDTIVPDGTSGYYFLSQPEILPGSEEVFIEVEELNRPRHRR